MPIPGIQNPTAPLVGGNSVREPILQSYVFQSGIHDPEVSSILTYKYPQYYLTSLLDRLNAEETIEQDIWSWFIMDRTRNGSNAVSIDAGGTGATATVSTDYAWSSTNGGYLIVGDLIRFESGEIARVTASADSGTVPGTQAVDVVRQAGGNWSAALLSAGDTFGHIASAFGEASSAPDGRLYLPTEEYNCIQRIRRSFTISGSEFTNKTYINGGESWYFEKEDIEMRELARDKEAAIMFGIRQTAEPKTTKGLWTFAEDSGVVNGFAAASGVSEADIQDHIKDLLIENVSNDIYALCGAQFFADAQRALADYRVLGGNVTGTTAGLNFQSYEFMGKTVHFAYYEMFNDPEVLPAPQGGAATASKVDFSNTSLWLDMGTEDNGKSLISIKYKSHGGNNRKFIHAYEVGMMNPNGENGGLVSSGDDSFRIHYLIECGLEVRLPNRLGILRATS